MCRLIFAEAYGWVTGPQACGLCHLAGNRGQGHAVLQENATTELIELPLVGFAVHLDPISLFKLEFGAGELSLITAIIGQEEQALAVRVQTACGVNAGFINVVAKTLPATLRCELAQDAIRLIESNQHGESLSPTVRN